MLNFVDPNNPNVHTQGIESQWNTLKRHLRSIKTNDQDVADEYYGDYMFRRWSGHMSGWEVFKKLILAIRAEYPHPNN